MIQYTTEFLYIDNEGALAAKQVTRDARSFGHTVRLLYAEYGYIFIRSASSPIGPMPKGYIEAWLAIWNQHLLAEVYCA